MYATGSSSEDSGKPKGPQDKGKGVDLGTQSAAAGSVLGSSKLRPAMGHPSLIKLRTNSKGEEVLVNLWETPTAGMTPEHLSRLLDESRGDQAYDMVEFIRAIEYQGFNRAAYIQNALRRMSVSVFSRFAIIGAVRGSNFTKIVDTCDQMPQDLITNYNSLGFVTKPKKRFDLTILRCTASTPHWCAYWMHKAQVEKKIEDCDCPPYLQFPGAASLPMSETLRRQHIEFCARFSSLLPGGKFNLNIYMTAYTNVIPMSELPADILLLLGVSSQNEVGRLSLKNLADQAERVSTALIKA